MLVLPATPETIAGFIAAAEAAPDELSTIANVMPARRCRSCRPEHHGKLVIFALMVHVGRPRGGQRAIAPFRALATPIADLIRPMTYPEMLPARGPGLPADRRCSGRCSWTRDRPRGRGDHRRAARGVGRADAGRPAARARRRDGPRARRRHRVRAPREPDHGRRRRVPRRTPRTGPSASAWVDELAGAPVRQAIDGAYVNFLGDEGEARVRAAYPGRPGIASRRSSARYDPTNLFRLNQNIPPSDAAASKESTRAWPSAGELTRGQSAYAMTSVVG